MYLPQSLGCGNMFATVLVNVIVLMATIRITHSQEYYYYDDYEDYDYTEMFKPESDFCQEKVTCSPGDPASYPVKNCYCDASCSQLNDCCPGHVPNATQATISRIPSPEVFNCYYSKDISRVTGLYFVTKCPDDWTETQTRSLCENVSPTDVLMNVPVVDNTTRVTFRNFYCAVCNSILDVEYWRPFLECDNETQCPDDIEIPHLGSCDVQYTTSAGVGQYRICPLVPVINQCPNNTDENLAMGCSMGPYSMVFYGADIYRNADCARCHLVPEEDILCFPSEITTLYPPPETCPRSPFGSYRMLVDFNSGWNTYTSAMEMQNYEDMYAEKQFKPCRDDQIYDPFLDTCRSIYCIHPLKPRSGRCMGNFTDDFSEVVLNGTTGSTSNLKSSSCTLIKLDAGEFEYINNETQIFIFASSLVYNTSEFRVNGTDMFICVDTYATKDVQTGNLFPFDDVEVYLSVICTLFSLVALAINFIVYIIFPKLRNTPGKILVCLISALFFSQLLFLMSPHFDKNFGSCYAFAVLMHFAFLAAFCWMDMIAVDLWITFSKQYIASGTGSKNSKRWYMYNLYAWLLPAAIVGISIVVNSVDIGEEHAYLKPHYGEGTCWIGSRYGLLLFFVAPLAFFKVFDLLAFLATARHIYVAKKHSALVRDKNDSSLFWIYLKLSLVMGLTWAFAFIGNLANVREVWYLFVIFNTLQGVFICVSFVFTKKVIRLLREKFQSLSPKKTRKESSLKKSTSGGHLSSTTSPTQLTTVSATVVHTKKA